MVSDLATRLVHCLADRGVLRGIGDDQFRVVIDQLDNGNFTSPGRPRLASTPHGQSTGDVFLTVGQGTNNPAFMTAHDGGNDDDGGPAGVHAPAAPPASTSGGNDGGGTSGGATASDNGGGGTASGRGDDVNVNIPLNDDDDGGAGNTVLKETKDSGLGDDVTAKSAFEKLKGAFTPLRKKAKEELVELRASELSFSQPNFLFSLHSSLGDGFTFITIFSQSVCKILDETEDEYAYLDRWPFDEDL
jgi:hypothetical protein